MGNIENAKLQLVQFQEIINVQIEKELEIIKSNAECNFSKYSQITTALMSDIVQRGGKRLRSSLVYKMFKMFGGEKDEEILRAATAIEIIHAYLLIEDDICDLSDLRRGESTLHKSLEKYHIRNKFKGDSSHFGKSVAIIAGLEASHTALRIIGELNVEAEFKIKALNNLNEALVVTGHGQYNDIFNQVVSKVSEQDVLNVHEWKTGWYTFQSPMQFGAMLAGTDKLEIEKLKGYAIPTGIAFQIQDDILGIFGTEDKIGKSTKDDLREGKHTLLITKALQNANSTQKEILLGGLGNSDLTDKLFADIKKVIIDTGALNYSEKKARDYIDKALKHLESNFSNYCGTEEYKYLSGIAEYIINRSI